MCEFIVFLSFSNGGLSCPDATALGTLTVELAAGLGIRVKDTVPGYSLRPAPGVAAKLGFIISDVPITVNLGVRPSPPYNIVGSLSDTSQVLEVFGSELDVSGNPLGKAHDADRALFANENVSRKW